MENSLAIYGSFIKNIKDLIYRRQYEAMKKVNIELIQLYWEIGEEIDRQQREQGWGKSVVEILAKELQKEFPGVQGFSARNLWRMKNFYIEYSQIEKLPLMAAEMQKPILPPLVAEISWSKICVILEKCKDPLQREFYIKMTKRFGWTKDVLINNIENRAFEKYLTNQTNLDVTDDDYYVDLLLFHRRLRCLIAIELKIGEFKPEYAGKMQFYLSALDETVKLPDENPSIGIIICKSKKRTRVEYTLKKTNAPIGVATYSFQDNLPEDMRGLLPTPDEIATIIAGIDNSGVGE